MNKSDIISIGIAIIGIILVLITERGIRRGNQENKGWIKRTLFK